MKRTLLLISGGQSTEHEITLVSANYIKTILDHEKFLIHEVLIDKEGLWWMNNTNVSLTSKGLLVMEEDLKLLKIDLVVSWIHGKPGETGHLAALCELYNIPFLGPTYENHLVCFNKVLTKLWCEKFEIPTASFLTLSRLDNFELLKAQTYFDKHGHLFVKASHQGSSVGCYEITRKDQLRGAIEEAFKLSPFVLIERFVKKRELEISVFQYQNTIHVTWPCEIKSPQSFYDFNEKYDKNSQAQIILKADLDPTIVKNIQDLAIKLFQSMQIKTFCRMDFFLEGDQPLLNEINTFPGLTPISMFPKMIDQYLLENFNLNFPDYFNQTLEESLTT
jgi:D-alanine-D-alanine ligase